MRKENILTNSSLRAMCYRCKVIKLNESGKSYFTAPLRLRVKKATRNHQILKSINLFSLLNEGCCFPLLNLYTSFLK